MAECYYECGKDVDEKKENEIQVGVAGTAYACPECRSWACDWKVDEDEERDEDIGDIFREFSVGKKGVRKE